MFGFVLVDLTTGRPKAAAMASSSASLMRRSSSLRAACRALSLDESDAFEYQDRSRPRCHRPTAVWRVRMSLGLLI